MNNKVYIDDIDVEEQYGIIVTSGSLPDLITFPPLKNVSVVDWYEVDGVDADLTDPQLGAREVDISFICQNDYSHSELFALLSDGAYHKFNFKTINQTYELRLLSQSALNIYRNCTAFTLRFSDDKTDRQYSTTAFQPKSDNTTGYILDGVDLASYGITILRGTLNEVLKSPDVKPNIARNYSYLPGISYEGDNVRYKSKEVELSCLLLANTTDEFWNLYNGLLNVLKSPGNRILEVDTNLYVEAKCYYNKCSSELFQIGKNGVLWAFQLSLIFTDFNPSKDDVLLASEEGDIVISEDNYAIDLDI